MRFEKRTIGFLVTLAIVSSVWAVAMALLRSEASRFIGPENAPPGYSAPAAS